MTETEPSMRIEERPALAMAVPPMKVVSVAALNVFDYSIKRYRIIDADTQAHDIDLGFRIKHENNVRLYGIDTPESSTTAGKLVERYVEAWYERMAMGGGIAARSLTMKFDDKYGGRYLGIVRGKKTAKGRFEVLNDLLVRLELAGGDYYGGTKPEWTTARLKETEDRARPLLAALGIAV